MIGQSRLPVVPIGDLQTEAGVAFRMKSGLAGVRLLQPKEAWRVGACVVDPLHMLPGRRHPALRGPAFGPAPGFSILPDPGSRPEGRRLGLAAGPASAASNWAWVRAAPPTAFPLERASERRVPLGRADLGTKFKDFKSTSWRLLEETTL